MIRLLLSEWEGSGWSLRKFPSRMIALCDLFFKSNSAQGFSFLWNMFGKIAKRTTIVFVNYLQTPIQFKFVFPQKTGQRNLCPVFKMYLCFRFQLPCHFGADHFPGLAPAEGHHGHDHAQRPGCQQGDGQGKGMTVGELGGPGEISLRPQKQPDAHFITAR